MTVRLVVSAPSSVSDVRLASSSRLAIRSSACAMSGGSQSTCMSSMRVSIASSIASRLATSIVPVGFS